LQWLLQPLQDPGLFFSSIVIFYTEDRTPWTSDKPVARPLLIHRTTQTQNKHIHRHPCFEWDSNRRSQRSSERRQFIPENLLDSCNSEGSPKEILSGIVLSKGLNAVKCNRHSPCRTDIVKLLLLLRVMPTVKLSSAI
jgi:hypothetical protein